MTGPQHILLAALADGKNCRRSSMWGNQPDYWTTPKGTTGGTVRSALKHGWVEEKRTEDYRSKVYTLTAKGRAALDVAGPLPQPVVVTLYTLDGEWLVEAQAEERAREWELLEGQEHLRAFGYGRTVKRDRHDVSKNPRALVESTLAAVRESAERHRNKAAELDERAQALAALLETVEQNPAEPPTLA